MTLQVIELVVCSLGCLESAIQHLCSPFVHLPLMSVGCCPVGGKVNLQLQLIKARQTHLEDRGLGHVRPMKWIHLWGCGTLSPSPVLASVYSVSPLRPNMATQAINLGAQLRPAAAAAAAPPRHKSALLRTSPAVTPEGGGALT